MKKQVKILIYVVVAIIATIVIWNNIDKEDSTSLKIACNLPMTGDLGYIGKQIQTGILFAIEEYRDSLLESGCNIDIDFQDNAGSAKTALTIFHKQKINHPDLYMSGVTTQTMSLIDIVKDNNIPHYIWSFTPLKLNAEDNMYRTFLNLGVEADQYIRIIKERNCKKVAFIFNDIIGVRQQCEEYIIPALKNILPDCNIVSIPFPVEASDTKNVILKAKSENPDLIIINGFKNNMINMVRDLRKYDMVSDNNIIGSFDLLDAAVELKPEELENITISVPHFLTNKSPEKYEEWRNTFVRKYGREPEYTDAYAYDSGHLLVEIAKKAKSQNFDIREALLSISFEGVTGHVQLDNNGDLMVPIVLCQFKNNKLIPIN